MKKLYFDCGMGAAGDMLTAALYELLPEPQLFLERMNALGLKGVQLEPEKSVKCGVTGTHMSVKIGGVEETEEHSHTGTTHRHDCANAHIHMSPPYSHSRGRSYDYDELCGIIKSLDLPDRPRSDALGVYRLLTEAEAHVHGEKPDSVHFHEVGALDALADIIGVCVLIDMLGVTEIHCSPVHVGSGTVRCAHGVLPVPAPAAARLLEGIPVYGGEIRGELCTPTGAALLKHFVTRFGSMQPMIIEKTGYGMGKKDFARCNCVRAFLGTDFSSDETPDSVSELSCNLDDMTGESLGFAMQLLLENGALDVFATPAFMKKNRPAYMLTVLCRPSESDMFAQLMLKHTTTLGVRISEKRRVVLSRGASERETKLGAVRFKTADGFGIHREKPEFDDVARIAREHGMSVDEVLLELE